MSISMVGIDYNKASVDVRAQFSFTKKNAASAMEKLKETPGILGCIILSTCNRMEIWASTQEAIEHLFYLTSGLKSQILAEDQIITQVKDALSMARDVYCTDNVLEVLFRMAVTAAKRVKTEVVFSRGNSSVIHQAIQKLRETGYSLDGITCMVIGNGEMGKVAALALAEAGAHVTVTVRQYRSGIVSIPKGCDRINYGERMEFFPSCDLIVSATASPNFTLTKELIKQTVTEKKQQILIDLAVPRDIEPSVKEIEGMTLYDIDSFKIDTNSLELQESIQKAALILKEQMEDFYCWYDGRSLIPRIQDIQAEAVQDLNLRILKILRKTPMEEEDRENLLNAIDTAAGKVVSKMMFGLRDTLEKEEFLNCVEGLEKLYGA